MKNKKKVAIKAPKRNLLTLLIVIAGLVVAFFVTATIVSYASLDKQMHEPFQTENQTYDLEDAIYMDGNEFNDFDLEFICTDFNTATNKAKFEITTKKFENQEIDIENVTIRVCLTADYLDYCKYSTERTHKLDTFDGTSSSSTYTHTVDLVEFPAKVDAFPFDIKVDAPKAYVFLQYKVTTNKIETKTYVLEFDYEDFNVQQNGIEK